MAATTFEPKGEIAMRFMMIVKANADSEAGVMPPSEELAAMGRYNEELIKAGVLLAAEGLHSSAKGARISKQGGRIRVVDGPFAETKELIAGFWLINVKSQDEALEWAKRIPFDEMGDGFEVELRKVHEASDFPADSLTEEHLRKEAEWREANQKPITG
jgi:hypothetical protein